MISKILTFLLLPDGVELDEGLEGIDQLRVVPVGCLCLMTRKTQRLKIESEYFLFFNPDNFSFLGWQNIGYCVHVSLELHLELKYRDFC